MCRILITVFFLLQLMLSFAQTNSANSSIPEQQKKLDALKGTYELRNIGNERLMPMLPSNLAEIIETNRKETEQNTVKLTESVILIIYPKYRVKQN